MADERFYVDYHLVTGRSDTPTIVVRFITWKDNWIVYYLHESEQISTYDGVTDTLEQALELFIKYRINGEPPPKLTKFYDVKDQSHD